MARGGEHEEVATILGLDVDTAARLIKAIPRGVSAAKALGLALVAASVAGGSGLVGGYAVAQDQAAKAGQVAGQDAGVRAAETYLREREAPLEQRMRTVEAALDATYGELRLNRTLLCQAANLSGPACPPVDKLRENH